MHSNSCNGTANPYITTFESEFKLIVANAVLWRDTETGGDLFGSFSHAGRPLIFLAGPPGPSSIHEKAHFQQDPDFTREHSHSLGEKMGIQYIGNHHSHHLLGLKLLSSGDILSSQSLCRKNGIKRFCQFLVTFDECAMDKRLSEIGKKSVWPVSVTIHAYYYENSSLGEPVRCPIKLIPGESPIRGALGINRRKFELPSRAQAALPSINYEEYIPTHRYSVGNRAVRDETSYVFERINQEIASLPEKIKTNLRFDQTANAIVLCLPLNSTSNLVLSILVRPNWKIASACIGSTIPDYETLDITRWIFRQNHDLRIAQIYNTVREHLRPNRSRTEWSEDRISSTKQEEKKSWPRKFLSFLGVN